MANYMKFEFILQTNSSDEEYESARAKQYVERILGANNVWDWRLVEVMPPDFQPIEP